LGILVDDEQSIRDANKENIVKTNALLVAALLGLSLGLTGCDTKDSPKDEVKDAFDARPHEGAKDAVEDIRDEAHETKEDIKRKAKDAAD
jgi:hypothetical protein